ncbi:uncharacterized protein SPSK_09670 [Sporothrix schenckii 1099-18]|uniref:Uncharacterized protein n=2 Tax=Sporothrix schenckii TaxID=29908 RepID=U7PW02_SPOS1|nr:uncharacterized protein SPSK_09670 [Sporothrix schenckii 1099-18]ERS99782.1 hypothetical protein HMPREF1624_03146 [Sporothrix schenckii ATCC 58251]KJR85837.1 hypothetical protein SPSK_09670 [Sporothrix schenckii 1099-18]
MKTGGIVVLVIVLLLLAAGVGWIVFARLRAQRLGLPPPPWVSFIPFYNSSRSSYGVQPAPSGIGGWFQDRFRSLKGGRNNRTAAGAYEGAGTSGRGAARHGFGPLDPDDAWDSRVGAEADAYYYNEEQELGLHAGGNPHANSSRLDVGGGGGGGARADTAYLGGGGMGGSSYDMNVPAATSSHGDDAFEERGRARGRSPHPATGASGGGGGGGSAPNPFDDDAADPSNISLRGVSPRPMIDTGVHDGHNDSHNPESPTERRSMFHENV